MIVFIGREGIVRQAASVNVMIKLFGDVCFVCRNVQMVSAAAKFIQSVILPREFGVVGEANERAETDCPIDEFRQFCVSVAVAVVTVSLSALSVNIESGFIVIGNDRAVHRRIVFKCSFSADRHQCMCKLGKVYCGFLCNDIDGSANSR